MSPPTPRPISTKGTPSPIENANSRMALLSGSDWVAARASVPASTGPMHGVQPAANAIPSGNAATRPGRTRDNSGRRSANNDADPNWSAYITRNTPTARTASPAIRWPAVERTMGNSTPANAPSEVNTTENPATNNSTGIVWRVRVFVSGTVEACLPPAAVTNDGYPGTIGSTHGD